MAGTIGAILKHCDAFSLLDDYISYKTEMDNSM